MHTRECVCVCVCLCVCVCVFRRGLFVILGRRRNGLGTLGARGRKTPHKLWGDFCSSARQPRSPLGGSGDRGPGG